MYNTFNGWKLRGRVVRCGERGAFRNEYGDMMFHRTQTKKKGKPVEVVVVARPVERIFYYV